MMGRSVLKRGPRSVTQAEKSRRDSSRRERIAGVELALSQTGLEIRGLTAAEREWLRERVWYATAEGSTVKTTMDVLPVVVVAVMELRGRASVKVRLTDGVYCVS